MRAALLTAAALFLAAHVVTLPSSFEDLDSLNFALGVRDYDVAKHQPHPPGYPVYIALAKVSTAIARAAGVAAPEVRGLAIWSALAGTVLVPLIFVLWTGLDGPGRAGIATALAVTSPLFWFTALRPLSDAVGLAAAVAAMAALLRSWPDGGRDDRARGRWLLAGAATAGLAVGIRSQTAVLTGPLLAASVLLPWSRLTAAVRGFAVVAFSAGVVTWALPLLIVSGGPTAYLLALSDQAGEDFGGVVMLWTHPTPRLAAAALLDTFTRPWDAPILAGMVLALAAAGAWLLLWRERRRLVLVGVMFAPYLLFHLLFQESITVRYALPVVLPVAWCAAAAVAASRRGAAAAATVAVCVAGLWQAVPAGAAFGSGAAPIFAAIHRMQADGSRALLGMHRRVFTESRRARQWAPPPVGRTLDAPRDLEWLELARALRGEPGATAWFLADPKRTDLALIDPRARRATPFRWPFDGRTYVGGARPDAVDLQAVDRPGWMLEKGWSLTPETAGVVEREGWTLDRQPATGWVRRRPGAATLVVGGRHLGTTSQLTGRLCVSVDQRELLSVDVTPGPFVSWADIPAGALDGAPGYAPLVVELTAVTEGDPPPVAIEQFDLQDRGVLVWAFAEGWQEPEYNPSTGRSWRWATRRAWLDVRAGGDDVVVRLSGENPRRYFAAAAAVRVLVGDTVVHAFSPSRDFTVDVPVPAAGLAAAAGRIVLETSAAFVPGDRDGGPDRRELALRLFEVGVRRAR